MRPNALALAAWIVAVGISGLALIASAINRGLTPLADFANKSL
jgi:hypothetical protein